jgi:hypothetical protein
MAGDHCFLTGGNGRLVSALAEGLPIFYSKTVRTIWYSDTGVRVHTADGQVFEGDMALSTIPLGVSLLNCALFPSDVKAGFLKSRWGLLYEDTLLRILGSSGQQNS